MSLRKVANVVGLLQIFVALSMFVTGLVAALYGGADAVGFFTAGAITFASCLPFVRRETAAASDMLVVVAAFDTALGKTMGQTVDWAVRQIAENTN